jgi:hypothetical protein
VKEEWKAKNPEKVKQYREIWRERNPTKNAQWKREGYRKAMAENPEKVRAAWKKYYDKDSAIARAKAWKKANPDKVAAISSNHRARKRMASVAWANKFFIDEAYHLAKLRTEATGFKWHVDHILPLNSPVVCGLHVEANLQVIPASVNYAKNNRIKELSWPY